MSAPILPPRQNPEQRHIPALDGIRGLAILMVLGHHLVFINRAPQTTAYVWSRAIVSSLWSGVDVFFALSGFLITGILLRTVTQGSFFRNFYARRALRVFPLYYGVLVCLFLCTHWLHIQWGGQQWRLLTYSNHIWLQPHAAGWNFYFGHVDLVSFWSLHVEEQFYLLWPLLIFLIRSRTRLLALALGLSCASLGLRLWLAMHGVAHEVLYATLMTRADNLLIGASLAIALETRFRAIALRMARPVFVLSTVALITIFFVQHGLIWQNDVLFSLQFTLLALSSTALIAMVLDKRSVAERTFSLAPLKFFGKYSYGLYVYHFVLPIFLLPPLEHLLAPIAQHAMVVHLIRTAVEISAAILVSMLSFHYFETPFLRLKRFFVARQTEPVTEEQQFQTVATI